MVARASPAGCGAELTGTLSAGGPPWARKAAAGALACKPHGTGSASGFARDLVAKFLVETSWPGRARG